MNNNKWMAGTPRSNRVDGPLTSISHPLGGNDVVEPVHAADPGNTLVHSLVVLTGWPERGLLVCGYARWRTIRRYSDEG